MDTVRAECATVLIVTVTYRAAEFVESYLNSVRHVIEQDDRFRLVLVDNESPDNTLEIMRDFVVSRTLEERMTIIDARKNGGFGFGCNLGAKARDNEEYIWFVNPDTQVDLDAALFLVDKLNAQNDLAAVGSMLKNERDEVRSGAFRYPKMGNALVSGVNLALLERLMPHHTTAYGKNESLDDVDWLTGASFMIRADAFEKIGGFDEGYFLYFEEVDLFYRLKKEGYRVASCRDSIVFHASGSSTGVNRHDAGKIQPRRPKYWYESRCRFYLKHFGRAYLVVLNIVHAIATLAGRLKDRLLGRNCGRVEHYLRDILAHSFFTPDKSLANKS